MILAEMGDARRFRNSDAAVRYTGLDVTVHASDTKRPPGHLAKQGPDLLRWALYEAAKASAKPASPHDAYYQQVKARRDAGRATLSVARKLARGCRATLAALGDDAIAPPNTEHLPPLEPIPLAA